MKLILASGLKEWYALPVLCRHFCEDAGVRVVFPDHSAALIHQVAPLLQLHWRPDVDPPCVILVDTHRLSPSQAMEPVQQKVDAMVQRGDLSPAARNSIRWAYAQPHLEAWFFADPSGLARYIGCDEADLGVPGTIRDPQGVLRGLMTQHMPGRRRNYGASRAKDIADGLDARVVLANSPSFKTLIDAIQ